MPHLALVHNLQSPSAWHRTWLTARVTDLFNVSYEILLQILGRFFAHTQEIDAQLKTASARRS
jgi:hypothetical protein